MQLSRKNVTSDPFVIFDFYELLESEVKRLGLENRPECIWNCDETGFPMDPSKFKTIGEKGKKAFRVACGANRENITVLAVNCADGTCDGKRVKMDRSTCILTNESVKKQVE